MIRELPALLILTLLGIALCSLVAELRLSGAF